MVRSRPAWRLLISCCLIWSWGMVYGSEVSMIFGDIVITEKKPFPDIDGNNQGYYMLTLEIKNAGNAAHRVHVATKRENSFHPYHNYAFSNEVLVEPRGIANLEFPIIWRGSHSGSLAVRIDDRIQEERFVLSFIPGGSYHYQDNDTYFLVSPDMSASFIGANEEDADSGSVKSALRAFGPGDKDSSQFLLLEPTVWPQAWLTFSPFDGLAFSADDWRGFNRLQRQAILDFLSLGGLVIFEGSADELAVRSLQAYETLGMSFHSVGFGLLLEKVPSLSTLEITQWRTLIPDAVQTGSIWDTNRYTPSRTLLSTYLTYLEREHTEFSVRTFSLMLLAFALVIGPLNLWFLSRIRRRIWLWWTIPAIASVACGLVFLWINLLEGRTPHEVQETVSILDQTNHQVHSIGRYGIYSPQGLGGKGLQFSRGSEIAPAYMEKVGFLEVDYREGYRFGSGWVPARIPAIFHFRKSDIRRERLAVDFEGEQARIVNGLGVPLEWLIIRGPDGRFFEVKDVAAGAEAVAEKIEKPDPKTKKMRQVLKEQWLFKEVVDQEDLPWPNPNQYLARTRGTPFGERPVARKTTKKERALIYGILGAKP